MHEEMVLQRLAGLKGTLVGLGVTAYPRSGLSGLVPGYRIACIRRTGDLPALRRAAEVFCLEEAAGSPLPEARDTAALLAHPLTRRYLAGLQQPVFLLLYQSSFEIERLAAQRGWRVVANPAALRLRTSDRAFFQRMVASLGLPAVPGRIVSFERFQERPYQSWAREMGPRLVIQLPDVLRGGGRSTFFLSRAEDHGRLRERLGSGQWQGRRLRRVSVRAFVEGEPCSVTSCIYGHLAFVSPLQRQIIDPPWLGGVVSNGVFGGHSWGGVSWGRELEAEARRQGLAAARVLASMGYRGVFGLDLLVDRDRGRVVPVELNPRLTGAFPVLTQLEASQGVVPLELLHLRSFLDPSKTAKHGLPATTQPGSIQGAHLLLFRGGAGALRSPSPRAGLYAWYPGTKRARWMGEAADLEEIRGERQVILADGPPLEGGGPSAEADPLERIGRLVFSESVLKPDGRFRAGVLHWVEQMYSYLLP